MSVQYALTIDGNYLLSKNVFALHSSNSLYDLPSYLAYNFKKLAELKGFYKIFFVSDSRKKSWRCGVYPDYKGTRKKDPAIDWEYAHIVYKEFKDILQSENKAIVLEEDCIEGDDWISEITKKLNKNNIGNLIMSADQDLQQLVDLSFTNNYMNIQFDDKKGKEKVFIPEGYLRFLSENPSNEDSFDLFDLKGSTNNFDPLLLLHKYSVVEINNSRILFKKIIEGDKKSDNIPPIWTEPQVRKDGKTIIKGIGDKQGDNIFTMFSEKNTVKFDSHIPFKSDVIDILEKVKGFEFTAETRNFVKNNLIRNIKLIYLHEKFIPEDLKVKLFNKINEHF